MLLVVHVSDAAVPPYVCALPQVRCADLPSIQNSPCATTAAADSINNVQINACSHTGTRPYVKATQAKRTLRGPWQGPDLFLFNLTRKAITNANLLRKCIQLTASLIARRIRRDEEDIVICCGFSGNAIASSEPVAGRGRHGSIMRRKSSKFAYACCYS